MKKEEGTAPIGDRYGAILNSIHYVLDVLQQWRELVVSVPHATRSIHSIILYRGSGLQNQTALSAGEEAMVLLLFLYECF